MSEVAPPARCRRWVRRIAIVLLSGVLLLILWCAELWRWLPRVERFEAEPGSISNQAFRRVRDLPGEGGAELRRRAAAVLSKPVVLITEKTLRAPSDDSRDYVSLSIYWWPNPLTRLPYLHHDGRRNPEAENYDAPKLRRIVSDVETLAEAFAATSDRRFLERAKAQLRTWFIAPETRMNPHLTFAQSMPGWAAGGRQGIVEGLPLTTRLPDALALFDAHGAFDAGERMALREWFGRYLSWLRHSSAGRSEHARPNNHGTWHDAQVASLAMGLGLTELAAQVVRDSLRRIETQFLADGRQPEELRRAKSFEYSLYNLDAWLQLAALGQRFGIDVWNHCNELGASPGTGLKYLEANVAAWPHAQLSPPSSRAVQSRSRRAAAFASKNSCGDDQAENHIFR